MTRPFFSLRRNPQHGQRRRARLKRLLPDHHVLGLMATSRSRAGRYGCTVMWWIFLLLEGGSRSDFVPTDLLVDKSCISGFVGLDLILLNSDPVIIQHVATLFM
jgi:hypothetical protein